MNAEQGITESHRAAGVTWRTAAEYAVRRVARRQPTFHVGDVWAEFEARDGQFAASENRMAMGGVLQSLIRDKAIVPTSEYVLHGTATKHTKPVRVWRSLLIKEDGRER